MYTLLNTNLLSLPPGSAGQGFYGTIPSLVIAAPPTVNQTNQQLYYQIQPAVYAPLRPNNQLKVHLSSDDVFIPEGALLYNAPLYNFQATTKNPHPNTVNATVAQARNDQNSCNSKASSCGSQPSSNSGSPNSMNGRSEQNSSSDSLSNPRKLNILDSLSLTNSSSESTSLSKNDDSIIHKFFPASLCAAINEDPPEPAAVDAPLKTSSPIRKENECKSLLIDFSNMRKRRGRDITSSSSEKCPRFSENGVSDDLDQCDKILIRSREYDPVEEATKKREQFLLILEAERERQKKVVLPKNTPKMSCKFCKNNGESPSVYTKHKLHHNEKTICPILRHYVCSLCNSTGDFAHTIRHCPFNDKKDKIAWKATFLV